MFILPASDVLIVSKYMYTYMSITNTILYSSSCHKRTRSILLALYLTLSVESELSEAPIEERKIPELSDEVGFIQKLVVNGVSHPHFL